MGSESTAKTSKKAATKSLSKDKERQKKKDAQAQAKKKPKLSRAQEAKLAKVVEGLIEGAPGIAAPRPLPLSALTKHKTVAWQWLEGGKLKYPIPIGCNRPLSPFRSDDE
ncbi:unnamed protein product [Durusdinium trenchii]|uniref:Uncharacterized protein n=2 Tax=Durusdinium trenchii TaxID=1381693 RepID=A0ABP0JZK9_9DINO